jgi:hypothetical protein
VIQEKDCVSVTKDKREIREERYQSVSPATSPVAKEFNEIVEKH